MPTIAERLTGLGVRQAEKVWGKLLTNLRTGLKVSGEFEEVEPIILDTEQGQDPREGSWFHFSRPLPDIRPTDRLEDADSNVWEVLTGYEDHPYKPRAKVKVKKLTNQDS